MFWLLIIILTCAFSLFALKLYIYGNDDYWPKKKIPFIKGSEVGSFWDQLLIRIPFHEIDTRYYNKLKMFGKLKYGGLMEFRRPVAMIMDLDLIKNITVKDFDHFVNRRPFGIRKDDPSLFGRFLFNMESQEWKDTRASMSPTFTTGKIRKMFNIFSASSNKMTEYLKNEIGSGKDINLRDPCSRYTMDVIASTAFGVESRTFKEQDSIFSVMGKRIQNQFQGFGNFKLFMAILLPDLFKALRINFMDVVACKFFADVITKTIEYRNANGERREDFLQLLLDARDGQLKDDDDGGDELDKVIHMKHGGKGSNSVVEWTNELILAQCLLFFVGGFDTIETGLLYALYELALNPNIQEKLAKEMQNAAKSEEGLSYDVINQNEYLDMVISETFRKYPPATRTERKCTKDYQIPGTPMIIPTDQVCIIPIYPLHHDPEYYPEPEKFIPERFNVENKRKRNPYTYIPFGVGPRNCIAMRFAITQSKTAVANLVLHFKIEPSSKTTIPMEFDTSGAFKPKYGMWLKLSPRD